MKPVVRRLRVLSLTLLLALGASGLPLRGQVAGDVPLIREVRFSGLHLLAADTLLFYLGLKVGEPLDLEALNRNIHELWERRLIDDIHVEAVPVEGGMRLEIEVVERPILVEIRYEGLKRISQSDILDRIDKETIAVHEGDPVDLGALQRLKAEIEALYQEKGFRFSEAKYSIEAVSPGERRVVFTIDEGDRVRIADIGFEGNTVFGDRRLRFAMKETKESGLVARFRKKDVYNAANLAQDLDAVREIYHNAGYKNVVIGEPRLDVVAKRPKAAEASRQKRRLAITIPIEEGERWKLGELSLEGNSQFKSESLLRLFAKPRGGWLRSNVIDEGVKAIKDLYSNTGYIFSQVGTEVVERPEQVADVVVKIDEGDQFRIGRIEFQGNTRTMDKVLRRQMAVQEGYVLNSGALRNSLLRIKQLEFFTPDENDPLSFQFDQEAKTVDLVVRGQETNRTEFQFGAGFSELDGFFGTVSFRTRNFLGRGETVGLNLQSGRFRDVIELSYLVPWFRDRPQTVGVQLFKRDLDFDLLSGQTFFQNTEGVTLTYGRNLGLFRQISMSYSRFRAEDRRSAFSLDGSLVQQELSRNVSSFRIGYSANRIDSRLSPTIGHRYGGSVEYAGGVIGGTTNFVRALANFSRFQPLSKGRTKTVLGLNFEAGLIRPFGEGGLFFNDRFFTGGENSIRGFRPRTIWVRDKNGQTLTDESGFPLGGEKVIQLNLEYHVIVNESFRFLLFGDAGNVYGPGQSVSLDLMRYTAGLELRVTVPLFGQPLRFIYAINLDPIDDPALGRDQFESFQFSLGTTF